MLGCQFGVLDPILRDASTTQLLVVMYRACSTRIEIFDALVFLS
jgi:hypothetical protein|tara:strand:- start:118 stop:249 length:132 start_codon:yes stop_codon:yes gene_type:complete